MIYSSQTRDGSNRKRVANLIGEISKQVDGFRTEGYRQVDWRNWLNHGVIVQRWQGILPPYLVNTGTPDEALDRIKITDAFEDRYKVGLQSGRYRTITVGEGHDLIHGGATLVSEAVFTINVFHQRATLSHSKASQFLGEEGPARYDRLYPQTYGDTALQNTEERLEYVQGLLELARNRQAAPATWPA